MQIPLSRPRASVSIKFRFYPIAQIPKYWNLICADSHPRTNWLIGQVVQLLLGRFLWSFRAAAVGLQW